MTTSLLWNYQVFSLCLWTRVLMLPWLRIYRQTISTSTKTWMNTSTQRKILYSTNQLSTLLFWTTTTKLQMNLVKAWEENVCFSAESKKYIMAFGATKIKFTSLKTAKIRKFSRYPTLNYPENIILKITLQLSVQPCRFQTKML